MKKLTLLLVVLLITGITYAQTSCVSSSGGNAFAGFSTLAQTITLSSCTGDYLHSIELVKSGTVSGTQINKVEIFSGASISTGDLLYSNEEVIDLPDNNGTAFTITFNSGTCNGGGFDCLQFTNGDVITVRFHFPNQHSFSGWGISTNNSNPYAGGTIWGNGSQVSIGDMEFDLMTTTINPLFSTCVSSSGGNAFAGFSTLAQTVTMSGCTNDFLHSIQLTKSGTVSGTQINKVEVFSGTSISAGDLLYSSSTVIDLPDNNGTDFTITFEDGFCNGGGTDCLQFTDGQVFTIRFHFPNQHSFSGWGISTNNSNPYAGGTIWGNGSQVSIGDMEFDLMVANVSLIVEPLPVELLSFEAQEEDKSIVLEWQTASEENNEGFEVQHSANGETWETLDFVYGNGTTLETQNYTYTDENPFEGINYYRLKQIDFDGQFEYSKIVNVELASTFNDIKIFPNPVQDRLTIQNIEDIENAIIYNSFGQVVKQLAVTNEQLEIDVTELPQGIYSLQLRKTNGTMITKQFVK